MTEARSDTTHRLAGFAGNLPLALFSSGMGILGLGLVWHTVESRWGLKPVVSASLTLIGAAVFTILLLAYGYKTLNHRDRVMTELRHPVRINFLPAIAINLILLGILSRPWSALLSNSLWLSGAALQLALTLTIVTVWLNTERPPNSLNPAWFIPAVGNVLVPIAAVPAGFILTGWFFFSIGLFYWIILGTLVFYRLVTGDALESPMRPTLAILMAPPSIAFLAMLTLTPGATAGSLVLYFIALLNFLLLIPQVPGFLKLPFYPSWWAYTFPLAAFTVATFRFAEVTETVHSISLMLLAGLTTIVISGVAGRTMLAIRRGELTAH